MPPAIEEDEEVVYESSSENAASPQRLTSEDAVMTDIFNGSKQPTQQPERELSPVPVVSDIPLIVSDIPQAVNNVPTGLTAPQPQNQTQPSKLIERGAQKRKASPKWTQSIALLAAYEAAIGPALRAIAGVTIPASEKGKRGPRKNKTDKKPGQGKWVAKPFPKQTATGTDSGPRSRHEVMRPTAQHGDRMKQAADSGPAPFSSLPQAGTHAPATPPSVHDPETFERLERQALRRRKVEALESLAHTAALFLAEFMDFRKAQAAAPTSAPNGTGEPPPPSPEPERMDPGAGSAYAAAAAGMAASMFQPPAGENGWQHDGAGEWRPGRPSDSESSASDSGGDDGDIPARVAEGKVDMEGEYDSQDTGSEDSDDYKMGSEAVHEGLGIKVEDD
ncbi:hypothetical protein VSDG_01110 [Cytospora chrysosperma]|uniref:Uncharacterized protein n=1 Tax=Cytospora chrysosperma TaxID=252740 RepID=A0A423WLL4_CYTCH|nr:hypothetical protein VSDG_01110 [Valsa sordida]